MRSGLIRLDWTARTGCCFLVPIVAKIRAYQSRRLRWRSPPKAQGQQFGHRLARSRLCATYRPNRSVQFCPRTWRPPVLRFCRPSHSAWLRYSTGSTIPLFCARWIIAFESVLEFPEETSTFGLQKRQNLHDTQRSHTPKCCTFGSAGQDDVHVNALGLRRKVLVLHRQRVWIHCFLVRGSFERGHCSSGISLLLPMRRTRFRKSLPHISVTLPGTNLAGRFLCATDRNFAWSLSLRLLKDSHSGRRSLTYPQHWRISWNTFALTIHRID